MGTQCQFTDLVSMLKGFTNSVAPLSSRRAAHCDRLHLRGGEELSHPSPVLVERVQLGSVPHWQTRGRKTWTTWRTYEELTALPCWRTMGESHPALLLPLKMLPQHLSLPRSPLTTPYPPPPSIHQSTHATGDRCTPQMWPGLKKK